MAQEASQDTAASSRTTSFLRKLFGSTNAETSIAAKRPPDALDPKEASDGKTRSLTPRPDALDSKKGAEPTSAPTPPPDVLDSKEGNETGTAPTSPPDVLDSKRGAPTPPPDTLDSKRGAKTTTVPPPPLDALGPKEGALTPPPDAPAFDEGGEPATTGTSPLDALDSKEWSDDETKKKRRIPRKVVPGLPRMQTFKRQQSEKRVNLSPVHPTTAERRAVSVDRPAALSPVTSRGTTDRLPRASAPDVFENPEFEPQSTPSLVSRRSLHAEQEPVERVESRCDDNGATSEDPWFNEANFLDDAASVTSSLIHEELETRWILNLSMHFRDKSKREKFFVTYREAETLWRRVTVSLDYRNAPENSLEMDLMHTAFQRDKSCKIYEAIRGSLDDIRFYDTVTNLKLQTTDGRLHVHVAEDLNEIIMYPLVRDVEHLRCHRVRERDIVFDSHMSGFVYKVEVDGRALIKKEIPGPDTINEFIYEINALHSLQYSNSVIDFFGVVVDDDDEHVKGLLISYAERGTLVDIIYDHQPGNDKGLLPLPWTARAMWAQQVVQGLADVHESGFVQGDFTLSNIVIDGTGNAKIIDINRRGCPVGWEPPESRPLVKSSQGISMYIGVKSDLYQLGMVLWALAMEVDEPERYGPGLTLPANADVPPWYRRLVDICLSEDPRRRMQASTLLSLFPQSLLANDVAQHTGLSPIWYDDRPPRTYSPEARQTNEKPRIRTVSPSDRFPRDNLATRAFEGQLATYEPPYPYPRRGRSPPSPLPSNPGHYDFYRGGFTSSWTSWPNKASYSDAEVEDGRTTGTSTNDRMKDPALRAHESESTQSPRGSSRGANVHGKEGTERELPSHLTTPDKIDERLELRKEIRAVVSRDDTQIRNAADREDVVSTLESTNADRGKTPGSAGSVGGGRKETLMDGLGIVSETGITEPNDPTTSESHQAPSIVPAGVLTEDRVDPKGPTEPEKARPNAGSATLATESSAEYNSGETMRVERGNNVEEAPRPSPACRDGLARFDACEHSQSGRASKGSMSDLTGVGGIDDDGRGDLTQFPTSLEDEPELTVATKLATMMPGQKGADETISSPISVRH